MGSLAQKQNRRENFVYDLPDNVTEIHEVFLDDALKIRENGVRYVRFSPEEECALGEVMDCKSPDWEILFRLYQERKINPMSYLKSEAFLRILETICEERYPYIAFADAFIRSVR